jgi:hypothetical protein
MQIEFTKRSSTTHSLITTQQQVHYTCKEDGPWQHMQLRRLRKAECFTARNANEKVRVNKGATIPNFRTAVALPMMGVPKKQAVAQQSYHLSAT